MIDSRTAPYAATLLRASLGVMFIAHALLKLFVFTLPGTAQFFASVGFPGWTAYLVFAAELAGGVLLVLGVQTRAVALALVPVLIGALYVHAGNGWLFTAKAGPAGRWRLRAARRGHVAAPRRGPRLSENSSVEPARGPAPRACHGEPR